ncbi:MAG: hypothetical protein K6E10_11830 [Eubacterium sp.]|nr:hypothetical protein [Eubacterium sp.]
MGRHSRIKQNILLIINLLLILTQGFLVGDLVSISFNHEITRGTALKDGLFFLIVCLIRLFLDRVIISGKYVEDNSDYDLYEAETEDEIIDESETETDKTDEPETETDKTDEPETDKEQTDEPQTETEQTDESDTQNTLETESENVSKPDMTNMQSDVIESQSKNVENIDKTEETEEVEEIELAEEKEDEEASGFSKIIINIAIFMLITVLSVILMDMFKNNTLSLNFMVMILFVLITVIFEQDIYLGHGGRFVIAKSRLDIIDEEEESRDKAPKGIFLTYFLRSIYMVLLAAYGFILILGTFVMEGMTGWFSPNIWRIGVILIGLVTLVFKTVYNMIHDTYGNAIEEYIRNRFKDRLPMSIITYIPEIIAGIILGVLLCFSSILVGLIYILGILVVTLLIPFIMDRIGTGGQRAIGIKCIYIGMFVLRIMAMIMLLLAVWLMSYGAIAGFGFILILDISMHYNSMWN